MSTEQTLADRQLQKTLLKPATLIVHTPTGPVASCESHAEKIKILMAFMGAYTNATPAPEGAECVNCKNEAKL